MYFFAVYNFKFTETLYNIRTGSHNSIFNNSIYSYYETVIKPYEIVIKIADFYVKRIFHLYRVVFTRLENIVNR